MIGGNKETRKNEVNDGAWQITEGHRDDKAKRPPYFDGTPSNPQKEPSSEAAKPHKGRPGQKIAPKETGSFYVDESQAAFTAQHQEPDLVFNQTEPASDGRSQQDKSPHSTVDKTVDTYGRKSASFVPNPEAQEK